MGIVRHPRAWVDTGQGLVPILSCEVTNNTLQTADTFHAAIPLWAPEVDLAYWSDADDIPVSIFVADGVGKGKLLFQGSTDHVKMNFEAGTMLIDGRDKTKELTDNKSTESFKNKTSSEIIGEVAGRRGLKPVIDSTSDKAGKQYKDDFAAITDQYSEWTLCQKLAEKEGKVCYVKGDELHFKDPNSDDAGIYRLVYVRPTPESYAAGNFVHLEIARNVGLAKGAKVKVSSWHTRTKKAVEAEEKSRQGKQAYAYRFPGLTDDQAKSIAKKKHDDHTRHEVQIRVDIPGDADLDPRMQLALSGTGTSFDQTYHIDRIQHHISTQDGYRSSISAKSQKDKAGTGGKGGKTGGGATVGDPGAGTQEPPT